MRKTLQTLIISSLTLTMLCLSQFAMAQANAVSFTLEANQQSLRDSKQNDTFAITLDDSAVRTNFNITCSAGRSAWAGLVRQDEACSIGGTGLIKNPNAPSQETPRVNYHGGYTVIAARDGFTDATTISASYLAVGTVPASSATFGGALLLRPENPGQNAREFASSLVDRLRNQAAGSGVVIQSEVDTITLDRFTTPSAGFPTDKGCSWTGDMLYAYQTSAWVMNLSARCGETTYTFKGNMPWIDIDGQNAKYVLNLTLPSAHSMSDEGLFMTAMADDALFAKADGIAATINIELANFVDVTIGTATEQVATRVSAKGDFVGTNVPLEVVRSFSHVFSILVRSMFGA